MTLPFNELTAIAPSDGRYAKKTAQLRSYFSEFALIKYRFKVEVEYFIALCEWGLPQLSDFPKDRFGDLRRRCHHFSLEDAQRVKEIEKTTNHDVKAVEYLVKEKMEEYHLGKWKEFVHFGLTSQDITNMALPLMMKDATNEVYLPLLGELRDRLGELEKDWEEIPLLALTHGQPASPTTLGKEIGVYVERLERAGKLVDMRYYGKFGGATGNFNAHKAAYPDVDWVNFGNQFVDWMGLVRLQKTTQIAHYDNVAEWCDTIKRINTIILDLNQDMWLYISRGIFKQLAVATETGSSAMPHKVNPIDFENSEGNIHVANSLFQGLAAKLPVSRWQRDLSDSTVTRNLGTPMAHSLIALQSTLRGLGKVEPSKEKAHEELGDNWAVVAEAIQTILRREGFPNPYETIKEFTRDKQVDEDLIKAMIESLDVNDEIKAELHSFTPWNYTGITSHNVVQES